MINENKTKYMIVPGREYPKNAINIKDLSFEIVHNFKYLEIDINY